MVIWFRMRTFILAVLAMAPLLVPSGAATAYPLYNATKNLLVILVHPDNDSGATAPYTQAYAQSFLGTASTFFNQVSYGNLTMNATVTPWLTIPAADIASCNISAISADAQAAAQGAGYTGYSNFLYVMGDFASSSYGYNPNCNGPVGNWTGLTTDAYDSFVLSASFTPNVTYHELLGQFFWGTIFGDGAQAVYCPGAVYSPSAACNIVFDGDQFDPLGIGPESAPEAELIPNGSN